MSRMGIAAEILKSSSVVVSSFRAATSVPKETLWQGVSVVSFDFDRLTADEPLQDRGLKVLAHQS